MEGNGACDSHVLFRSDELLPSPFFQFGPPRCKVYARALIHYQMSPSLPLISDIFEAHMEEKLRQFAQFSLLAAW